MKTVKFKDLSGGLKTFVILGWVVISMYVLAFIVGVIEGLIMGV